jgi:hypothetical protein
MSVREGVPSEETLFELVGDARLVLIGEASHGTHDFYAARAAMTRRLIEQRGFRGVAVEADWPDAYRVNRYVHGRGEDATAEESMRDFRCFPSWMWRNTAVLDFVGWLREHNDRARDDMDKTGFYGTGCTACTGPWRRSSPSSSASTRTPPRAPANATPVSTTPAATTASSTGSPPPLVPGSRASARWSSSWSRCSGTRPRTRDGLLAED